MSLIEPLNDADYLDRWRRRSRPAALPVVRAVTREPKYRTFSEPHTVPTFEEYMARHLKDGHRGVRKIVLEVAQHHGVTVEEIVSKSNLRRITLARQEAMWAIYMGTGLTFSAIGMRLGKRDHSTIWTGVRAHAERHGLPVTRGALP